MESEEDTHEARAERIEGAMVGALFVGAGILILALVPEEVTWYHIAALVVAGLGLDAILSAIRGKRSLLSRLSPLP